jgi:hypothetical protein
MTLSSIACRPPLECFARNGPGERGYADEAAFIRYGECELQSWLVATTMESKRKANGPTRR